MRYEGALFPLVLRLFFKLEIGFCCFSLWLSLWTEQG